MHITKGKRYYKAAREANLKVLKEADRWEVNAPDENGMTPLLWAAHEGHLEAVRVLLKRKSKVSKVDNFGNSALHLAAARGHLECVKLVYGKGANLYGLDAGHRTACDLAKIGEWDEVVEFLERMSKLLEERKPKLVLTLKELADTRYVKLKQEFPGENSRVVVEQCDEYGELFEVEKDPQLFDEHISKGDLPVKEEDIEQQNANLLGLIQHKCSGLTASTSKSTARSHLVFAELIKEQSINQAIVNSLETQKHRKPIKRTSLGNDDEESDTTEEDSTAGVSKTCLLAFLKIYDLQRLHQRLLEKGVDLDGLMLMTEHDIKALGLPLGPHRKLCFALDEYKSARKWDEA